MRLISTARVSSRPSASASNGPAPRRLAAVSAPTSSARRSAVSAAAGARAAGDQTLHRRAQRQQMEPGDRCAGGGETREFEDLSAGAH